MPSDAPRRPAPLRILILAFLAYSGAHLVNNTLLRGPRPQGALDGLQAASGGWIEPVLLRSQVVLAAFLIVVLVVGRRRLSDIGWRARHLLPGILVWASAWCLLQLVLLTSVVAGGGSPEWHPMWARFGIGAVLGGVLAQALGHALVEDTAFRGFFLPQLRTRCIRAFSVLAMPLVLLLAVVGSALLFGLAHLPTLALVKDTGSMQLLIDQLHFLSAGMALGVAYLATRNLFAVVALHVLLNDPAPLVAVSGTVLNRSVLLVFGLVVLACGARSLQAWWRRLRLRERGPDETQRRAA